MERCWRSWLYTLPLFELEQSLIYRGGDQKREGKAALYLNWINMYSSAGSNPEKKKITAASTINLLE